MAAERGRKGGQREGERSFGGAVIRSGSDTTDEDGDGRPYDQRRRGVLEESGNDGYGIKKY